VIAAQVNNESKIPIAVVLDARRSEIYMQLFSPEGTPINAPFCLTPKVGGEILNSSIWLVCGNGTELIRPHLSNNQSIIHVSNTHTGVLAELAAQADKNQQPPSPVYVRPPDAVLPKNAGRLRL
jgi:tRNA threonylcarbamoyladenosine biosynthesis protein TsaB